jgi:hypothetical protein
MLTLVVLVDGEIWTDESVFWQNKLIDGASYEVVYSYGPPPPSFHAKHLANSCRETMVLPNRPHPIRYQAQGPVGLSVPLRRKSLCRCPAKDENRVWTFKALERIAPFAATWDALA